MPKTPRQVVDSQNQFIDNLVGKFERELGAVTRTAQAATLAILAERLTITNGRIDQTPGNQRVLRQVGTTFSREMVTAGYRDLSQAFAAQFSSNGFRLFRDSLRAIGRSLQTPLPDIDFTLRDRALFESIQLGTVDMLRDVVSSVAVGAERQALLQVGGLPFRELAAEMSRRFGLTITQAAGLAETAMTVFMRTIQDVGFRKIEADLPAGSVRYRYAGPLDKITRPFCRRTLRRQPMTRQQINRLNNGQIPNVFATGGGHRCRHQWIIAELGVVSNAA